MSSLLNFCFYVHFHEQFFFFEPALLGLKASGLGPKSHFFKVQSFDLRVERLHFMVQTLILVRVHGPKASYGPNPWSQSPHLGLKASFA